MEVTIGNNIKCEIQNVLAAAKTISGISNASPGVVTSNAHGYANGDIVVLSVSGMPALDGQACRVSGVTTNTFNLEGIDTTTYGTFAAGSCRSVTSWHVAGTMTSISLQGAAGEQIEVTTLGDIARQFAVGLAGSGSGTMSGFYSASDAALAAMRAAGISQTPLAMRFTLPGNGVSVCNTLVSGGQGFNLSVNQPVTAGDVAITVRGVIVSYAS